MRDGWQTKRLFDLVEAQNGYAFSSKDYSEAGHFLMRIGNVQNGYITTDDPRFIKLPSDGSLARFTLRKGDILVSLTGNVGRVGVIKEEHLPAALNQRVARLSIRKDSPATRELVLLFLCSDWFREELIKAGHGAAQQNVSTKDLLEIHFPVPPQNEQKRIVQKLDEAFAGIAKAKENAEKNLQNARALFESHLQAVFKQRGSGWEEKSLGDTFTTITGATPPKDNKRYYGDFLPLVKPPELRDDLVDTAPDKLSEEGAAVARTLPPRSILVSCIGNLGKIGLNTVPLAFNQQINAILIDERKAVPEFMFFQALSLWFKKQLETLASGTTVPIVNKSKFNSVKVVIPSPLIQKVVAAELSLLRKETQRFAKLYEQKLEALEALKKTILHEAFSGNL